MALSSQSKINDKKEDIAQFIKQIIEELYKIYERKLNKYKDASGGSNDIDAEGQASAGTGTQETSDGTMKTTWRGPRARQEIPLLHQVLPKGVQEPQTEIPQLSIFQSKRENNLRKKSQYKDLAWYQVQLKTTSLPGLAPVITSLD